MTTTISTHGFGIVPALDTPDAASGEYIVRTTHELIGITGYKVGLSSVLELGLAEAVARIRALTKHTVIYDHQKAGLDVPSNATGFAQSLKKAAVTHAIVFPVAGPSTAKAYTESLLDAGITPIVGGELATEDYLISRGGWIADDILTDVVHQAIESGVTHFVAPLGPQVRRVLDAAATARIHPTVYVPGIQTSSDIVQLSDVTDSANVYAIVGRAITRALNPQSATRSLIAAFREGEQS
jgi:orotidine-5'-phosphate decarboxylase